MPNVADVLIERYELRESLASDDSGEVFRAWDRRQRREVFVQTYQPARLPAGALRRYKAAIDAARRAPHPAVTLPLELCLGDARPFAAFEPPTGEDLEAFMARVGVVAWGRALELVGRCAEGLATVTAATGVFHGALHLASIRISADGQPHIVDLGAAELGVSPVLPRGGKIFVEYRAPEQLDGSRGSARSDIYTLGVLLFELLTAIHPFSGTSAFLATHAAALGPLPSLQTAAPGMSVTLVKTVQQFLDRALARDPQARFADMGQMARALDLVRRVIGSPVAPATGRPARGIDAPPASPAAPRVIEDPTTMLQISQPKVHPKRPGAPERRARVAAFANPASSPVPPPASVAVAVVASKPPDEATREERPSPRRSHPAPREEAPVDRTEVVERRRPLAAAKPAPVSFEEPHTLVRTRTPPIARPQISADIDPTEEHTEVLPVSPVPEVQAGPVTSDRTLLLPNEEPEPERRALEPTRAVLITDAPLAEERTAIHDNHVPQVVASRRDLTMVYIAGAILVLVVLLVVLLRL